MNDIGPSSDRLDPEALRAAFEASRDCIAVLTLDGCVITANDRAGVDMGCGGPGPATMPWMGIWAEADRDAARRAVALARQGGLGAFQGALADPSGASRRWDVTVRPILGRGKRPSRLLAVARDVTPTVEAERAFNHLTGLYRALIEATSEIIWHVDMRTGRTDRIGYAEYTGCEDDPDDMDGWLASVHPDDQGQAKRAADQAFVVGTAMTIEYRLLHVSGEWRWVEDHASPILGEDGAPTDWVGVVTDIHDRKRAEQALRKNADHLRLALEATGLGTWDVDERTGVQDWSGECSILLGRSEGACLNRLLVLADIHPDDRRRVHREMNEAPTPERAKAASVFRLVSGGGPERWIEAHERTFFGEDGTPIRRVGTMQDVTDRKRAEQEIWTAAHTDALTGIANRAVFQSRMDQAVADSVADGARVGLLMVDLDRFKDVNDTMGHEAGDALLRGVARRLSRLAPPGAVVARLGGDEFGILVPASGGAADLAALAEDCLRALEEPMAYGECEMDGSASIGWSVFPDHDPRPGRLLKNADMALHAAKAAGRGQALAFTLAMRDVVERRITVLRNAKDALIRDAVLPFYQPKVSVATGQVVGFESLLRWRDHTGLRSPGAIQEALDDPELSIKLGARMLDRISADMRGWVDDHVPFGHVALNVAAPEFHRQSFSGRILDVLAAAGLRPGHLEIEVTERVLLDGGTGAIGAALKVLSDAGSSIALDDFGTGYASLTHLTVFPVDWVKVDRSFVMDMARDDGAAAIVRAVIGLAHSLGIRVVAEGIETAEQLDLLSGLDCDVGQGFLIAKPMSASHVPAFLKVWTGGASLGFARGREPPARQVRASRLAALTFGT